MFTIALVATQLFVPVGASPTETVWNASPFVAGRLLVPPPGAPRKRCTLISARARPGKVTIGWLLPPIEYGRPRLAQCVFGLGISSPWSHSLRISIRHRLIIFHYSI